MIDWHEEAIRKDHKRGKFDCGEEDLNLFLRQYARQAHEKGGAKTFLAICETTESVLGFYSLSPASVDYEKTPEILRKGLARHEVPAFRLGRLAVDKSMQGKGLGGQLLLAAGRRCLRAASEVGGVALIIDAKNEKVAAWYKSYGALDLPDTPLTLFLPLATISKALIQAGKI